MFYVINLKIVYINKEIRSDNLSQFSGKCDFYDSFIMIHSNNDKKEIEENLKKLTLYVQGADGRKHKVKSDTIKDIAKYYPYLKSIAVDIKDIGYEIVLSNNSYIDQEENQMKEYRIRDVLKYWRKCKRNKIPFTIEGCKKELGFWHNWEVIEEIINRIIKFGDKAEFDDIHIPLWEYYRRNWFKELVRVGYSEIEAYNWSFNALLDSEDIIIKRLGRPLRKG